MPFVNNTLRNGQKFGREVRPQSFGHPCICKVLPTVRHDLHHKWRSYCSALLLRVARYARKAWTRICNENPPSSITHKVRKSVTPKQQSWIYCLHPVGCNKNSGYCTQCKLHDTLIYVSYIIIYGQFCQAKITHSNGAKPCVESDKISAFSANFLHPFFHFHGQIGSLFIFISSLPW